MTPVKEEEVVQDHDEEMEEAEVKQEPAQESEEELVKEPTPAQAASAEERPATQEESEEEEEDAEEVTAAVLEEPAEATPIPFDEEEHSLLDPPISTIPLREVPQPPPPPPEPEGPKARLVIHKMALINFKSYAGRQDIGPFHKVRFSDPAHKFMCWYNRTPAVVLSYSWAERIWQVEHHRCAALRLRFPCDQDASREALRTHSQLGEVPGPSGMQRRGAFQRDY